MGQVADERVFQPDAGQSVTYADAVAWIAATWHCPYCGSSLAVESGGRTQGDPASQYCVLQCDCYAYPVVYGIPILQQMPGLEPVVASIRAGELEAALLQALKLFRVTWARQGWWYGLQYRQDCRRAVAAGDATFKETVELLRKPESYSGYLFHRYANPSLLSAIGPLTLLGGVRSGDGLGGPDAASPARILDLGCGAGHASYLIRRFAPESTVVSVDLDFVNVYLARRFMAPEALQVCLDVEAGLPFPDGTFDAVFSLDAFHYMKSKTRVVEEVRRSLTDDALWIFAHLHNRLQPNPVPGTPLSPAGYQACFESVSEGRLFDETELFHGIGRMGAIDLTKRSQPLELDAAHALTYVGGWRRIWDRAHNDITRALCELVPQLTLNPIYRARRLSASVEVEMSWPDERLRSECIQAESILPLRRELTTAEWSRLAAGEVPAEGARLAELVSQFVLVPLPPRYAQRPVLQ